MFLSQNFLTLPRRLFLTHYSPRAYFSLTLSSICVYFEIIVISQWLFPTYPCLLSVFFSHITSSLVSLLYIDHLLMLVFMLYGCFSIKNFPPLPRCLFLTHCSLRAYFSLTLPSLCIYFLNHQNFSPPNPPSLLSSLCPVSHSLISLSLCPHLTHNTLSSSLYSSLISLCLSPSLLSLTLSINTSHGLCHYFYLMSTFPDR